MVRVLSLANTDAGSYDIKVTSTLSNLDVWSGNDIDPALKIDKLNPPSNFVHKADFTFTLNLSVPVTSSTNQATATTAFVQPTWNVTEHYIPPYLLPKP